MCTISALFCAYTNTSLWRLMALCSAVCVSTVLFDRAVLALRWVLHSWTNYVDHEGGVLFFAFIPCADTLLMSYILLHLTSLFRWYIQTPTNAMVLSGKLQSVTQYQWLMLEDFKEWIVFALYVLWGLYECWTVAVLLQLQMLLANAIHVLALPLGTVSESMV